MYRRDFEKKNLKSGSGGIWTQDLLHAKFYSIKIFEDTKFYFIKIMSLVFWKFEDEHSPAKELISLNILDLTEYAVVKDMFLFSKMLIILLAIYIPTYVHIFTYFQSIFFFNTASIS